MQNVPSDREGKIVIHICPVCGKSHTVNQARHSVAWGRQFTCSCDCEAERRRRMRTRLLAAYSVRAQDKR